MTAVRYSYLVDNTAGRAGSRVAAAGGAERESNPCPSRFCKRDALPLSYSPLRGARTMVISSRFVKHGPWHKKLNVGLRRIAGYYKSIATSTSTVVPCAITSEP